MSAKSKQAQRTKNNVRPSSSGRSAVLLGTSGVGFGVVGGTALFPTLAASVPDAALPPDLALCIKKLNKKDPITKTKALQELSELVEKSDVDDVVVMLPNWSYFYKILTVDPDRRVRELTQACHGTIVGSCGRRVAPQLKALLPSWLAAQHDDHAPARSRAQQTLHCTFPENKLPEAISFCKAEVLAHIKDNLLDCNASVSKKLDNEEDRLAAVTRILCSALGGLWFIAQRLPDAHSDWLWEELTPLLKAQVFWKLAGHAASEVRSSWYSAVAALATRFGGAGGGGQWARGGHSGRALKLVLGAREGGGAARALWQGWLQLVRADPDWYSAVEKKDLVTKRIVEGVSGGWGGAMGLAHPLPALLELLPDSAVTEEFTAALLEAFHSGLEMRSVASSKIESTNWIRCATACVRVLAERGEAGGTGGGGGAGGGVVARWLQLVLGSSQPHAVSCAAGEMLRLLARWAVMPRWELSVRGFWQSAACHMARDVTTGSFLLALHTALHEKPKKRAGVRFEDDNEVKKEEPETRMIEEVEGNDAPSAEVTSLLEHQLEECVARVCGAWLERARGGGGKEVGAALRAALPVLGACGGGGGAVWAALGGALHASGPASPLSVWTHALRPWLADRATCCEEAVRLAFLLVPHLTEDQQTTVFSDMDQLDSPTSDWALPLCVELSAAPAPAGAPAGAPPRAWLRSAPARAPILRAARAALAGDKQSTETLLACLTTREGENEPVAGVETVSEVLQVVAYVVESSESADAPGARLADKLVPLLAPLPPRAAPPRADMLAALCQHDLNHQCEVPGPYGGWRFGLGELPEPARALVVQRVLGMVRHRLPARPTSLDAGLIAHCAGVAAALADHAAVVEVCAALCEDDVTRGAGRGLAARALQFDIVDGRLNCPFDDHPLVRPIATEPTVDASMDLSREDFLQFAQMVYLRACYIRSVCDCDCEAHMDNFPLVTSEEYAIFADLLHKHAIIRELREGYAFWPEHEVISSAESLISSMIEEIGWSMDEARRMETLHLLVKGALSQGFHWALAAASYWRQHVPDPYDWNGRAQATLTGDGFFHLLQASTRGTRTEEVADGGGADGGADAGVPDAWGSALAVGARCLLLVGDCPSPFPSPRRDVAGLLHVDALLAACQRARLPLDTDISSASWAEAVCAASVADFLSELVRRRGWDAPPHQWDFTTITLASLLSSLHQSRAAWGTTKVALVSVAVLRLLRVVAEFIQQVPALCTQRQPSEHVAALPAEWRDVFLPSVAHHLYSLLYHILEDTASEGNGAMTVSRARVVAELCTTLDGGWVRHEAVPAALRGERGAGRGAGAAGALGAGRGARAAGALLAAPAHWGHKYLAHYTLAALQETLVLEDAEKLREWSASDPGDGSGGADAGAGAGAGCAPPAPPLTLDRLRAPLEQLQDLLAAALAHLKVGVDTCSLVPGSDTHSLALGYLLLVAALGSQAALHRGQLALHCAELVRTRRHTEQLLPAALRLLPARAARHATDPTGATPAHAQDTPLFHTVHKFSIDEPADGSEVAGLACRAVTVAVAQWPAGAARGWWGAASGAAGRALLRLVAAHTAPVVTRALLGAVAARAPGSLPPDTTCTVHYSAREMVCSVVIEDQRLELSIVLSPSHPLTLPTISSLPAHPRSPAPSAQWLAVYMAYQNGSLVQAARMWAGAVAARVEAAPQCYICYCRLHPASGRLPAVPCHQCKNRFHPECLGKWFQSSNKSNCPLCRTPF